MKVVISQPRIIFGGRIKVLLGITEVFNQLGTIPIWLTSRMPGPKEEILERYSTNAKYDLQILNHEFSYVNELGRVRFNQKAVSWCNRSQIDWMVNSSNTVQGFYNFKKSISYVHFPREARVSSPLANIHDLDSRPTPLQKKFYRKLFNRLVFALGSVDSDHLVVSNSEFTSNAWKTYYKNLQLKNASQVIYPFADNPVGQLPEIEGREPAIVSLGRFCEAKRQLDQVRCAEKIPSLEFWLIGHAGHKNKYFQNLVKIIDRKGMGNVSLLPDSTFSEVSIRLRRARYFLHTNINEPFGITAVEAILAGCLPIVHDSGGQREVVPIPELRFRNLAELPEKLKTLEEHPEKRTAWVNELRQRALKYFIRERFLENFCSYFQSLSQ